jgi:hypothetical protein
VVDIPSEIKSVYKCEFRKAINKKGHFQKFGTAVLVKSTSIFKIELTSELDWVNKEIQFFMAIL